MDQRDARAVRVGDRVLYEGAVHAVAAVVREGLWEGSRTSTCLRLA